MLPFPFLLDVPDFIDTIFFILECDAEGLLRYLRNVYIEFILEVVTESLDIKNV